MCTCLSQGRKGRSPANEKKGKNKRSERTEDTEDSRTPNWDDEEITALINACSDWRKYVYGRAKTEFGGQKMRAAKWVEITSKYNIRIKKNLINN